MWKAKTMMPRPTPRVMPEVPSPRPASPTSMGNLQPPSPAEHTESVDLARSKPQDFSGESLMEAPPSEQDPVQAPTADSNHQASDHLKTTLTGFPKPKLTVSTALLQSDSYPQTLDKVLSPLQFADSSKGIKLVVTPELIAMGEWVAAMKRYTAILTTAFESLGEQSDRAVTLGTALKAREQLERLRGLFEQQLEDHQARATSIQADLKRMVTHSLSDALKAHVRSAVEQQVKERVAHQLSIQIPEKLRQQIKTHQVQIVEVQRALRNSEARQHNSALGPSQLNAELRPLLRPLSTTAVADAEAASPSPLFPTSLRSLFALQSEEAETLVKEYGLADCTVPVTPIATEAASPSSMESRTRNLNKFMAHIGVVGFQMHALPGFISTFPVGKLSPSPLIISIHPGL
ncbi:unnamed protein product [Mycena citricolor]|uniref:Uncharacterized protein n=1 Tax=Mycena citricolor TaxID=2018698 RepID=A0AAD2HT32_9AGAR|nr:unnamed protein product [Mycena citricolor]